jgi:hypothetical protein
LPVAGCQLPVAPIANAAETRRVEIGRARWLVSGVGRAALASLPAGLAVLAPHKLADLLRPSFVPAAASALAEQVTLRALATGRFGYDLGMLYTTDGMEMMTHPAVAARRATRLAGLGLPVGDLTCGLGGDLRAVAALGLRAVGVERDGATALLASANVPEAGVLVGNAAFPPLEISKMAAIIDPSRREGGGRRFDPAAFSPPWDVAIELLKEARAGVMKAPPGIEHRHIPEECELEFVQLGRSMREAALWAGDGAIAGLRRAVLLPEEVELDSAAREASAECRAPGAFLFDPESCVTRAGLVRQLAARVDAWMLDPQIAYLSSADAAFDPLCATFEVLEQVPFSVARLRQALRRGGWRPEEIRRRGFPVEPDELRRLLGRLEGEPVTVLLTTLAGKRTVFIARRLHAPPAGVGE